MQPDQQNNYQQKEPNQESMGKIPEMYTPEPTDDEPTPNANVRANVQDTSASDVVVHWSAKEYIYIEKSGLWFVVFAIVALILIAVDFLFIKSYTFSVLVFVAAIAVIVYSRRPPRIIDYTLSGQQGLYIGDRLYHFSEFKAFGLIRDGEHNSIMLIPTKRFSFGVSVYFSRDVGEQIVDILGARLPMKITKLDLIDKIVRKIRL